MNPSAPLANVPPATNEARPGLGQRTWQGIRGRILGGLVVVLPVLITLWVIGWLFLAIQRYVIDPIAWLVVMSIRKGQPGTDVPQWFELYAAPPIAIALALLLLFVLGFFVKSRLRRAFDAMLLRIPVISVVYDGVQKIFQTFDNQQSKQRPQRVVLVEFPHPGMKVPAFVTSTCRDLDTGRTLLCVYVPTTPVPTSGYFLMLPEEDAIELNWTTEETLQSIISGGLTVPPEVRFFKGGRS